MAKPRPTISRNNVFLHETRIENENAQLRRVVPITDIYIYIMFHPRIYFIFFFIYFSFVITTDFE